MLIRVQTWKPNTKWRKSSISIFLEGGIGKSSGNLGRSPKYFKAETAAWTWHEFFMCRELQKQKQEMGTYFGNWLTSGKDTMAFATVGASRGTIL